MIRRFSLLAFSLSLALAAIFAAAPQHSGPVSTRPEIVVAAKVPRPAPELKIEQVGGPTLSLSQYRGKAVALAFVMTTCPHCQHFSEVLNKMYEIYGARGFQPIAAAFNEGAPTLVNAFKTGHNLKFPVGVVSRDEVYKFLEHPVMEQPFYVPQVVFVDRRGVIRDQYAGDNEFFLPDKVEANLRNEIEKLLRGSAAGHPSTASPR